ncbi:MAG: class I SAM-dependent methyltransferase [Anaerolineae bacterium]
MRDVILDVHPSSPPAANLVAAAYDSIAADYDSQVQGDDWMRRILWANVLAVFEPGDHILDVTCGTGTDAIFLAQHGMQVTALDISPGMAQMLRHKAARAGVGERVRALVGDAAALAIRADARFDGVVSTFAGLNTLPDLAAFACAAARLLRPGGHLIVHMLSRRSAWEWLALAARGRWRAARTLGSQSRRVYTIGGQPVPHFLYLPREAFGAYFARHFRLQRAYSLGALRPPHTLHGLPPPIPQALGALERPFAAHPPLLDRGRFFVLDMVRR